MCCGRQCNPGRRELSIDLPVAENAPEPDRRWAGQFAASLADVARSSRDWTAAARRTDGEIVLSIRPVSDEAKRHLESVGKITFFTEEGWIDPNKPESLSKIDGGIVLTQTVSEHAPKSGRFTGILVASNGWLACGRPKAIRISVPLRDWQVTRSDEPRARP
jgi:DsbC/DsbD-like thiol-disulfide interchange protein